MIFQIHWKINRNGNIKINGRKIKPDYLPLARRLVKHLAANDFEKYNVWNFKKLDVVITLIIMIGRTSKQNHRM